MFLEFPPLAVGGTLAGSLSRQWSRRVAVFFDFCLFCRCFVFFCKFVFVVYCYFGLSLVVVLVIFILSRASVVESLPCFVFI